VGRQVAAMELDVARLGRLRRRYNPKSDVSRLLRRLVQHWSTHTVWQKKSKNFNEKLSRLCSVYRPAKTFSWQLLCAARNFNTRSCTVLSAYPLKTSGICRRRRGLSDFPDTHFFFPRMQPSTPYCGTYLGTRSTMVTMHWKPYLLPRSGLSAGKIDFHTYDRASEVPRARNRGQQTTQESGLSSVFPRYGDAGLFLHTRPGVRATYMPRYPSNPAFETGTKKA
jgi:hypothetical protein